MKKIVTILLILILTSIVCSTFASAWYDRTRSFVYERESDDHVENYESRGYRDFDENSNGRFSWSGRFSGPSYNGDWDEETTWSIHNERERVYVEDTINTYYSPYSSNRYSRYNSNYYPSYSSNRNYPRYSGNGFRTTNHPQIAGLYDKGIYAYI